MNKYIIVLLISIVAIFLFLFSSDRITNSASLARKQLVTMSAEEMDADWKLNEFFGTIFIINLKDAVERRNRIIESLKTIGVKEFEIIEGIDGRKDVDEKIWKKFTRNWAKIDLSTPEGQLAFDLQRQGEAGCYLSHLKVLEIAKARFDKAVQEHKLAVERKDSQAIAEAQRNVQKYKSILILEDDNDFGIVTADKSSASLKSTGTIFRKAMTELPDDWHLFYLIAWAKEPEQRISPHVVKLNRAILTNAYAVNYPMYDIAIARLSKIYSEDFVNPIDNELGQLQKLYPCYAITPSIAYQTDGKSHITGKTASHLRQEQPVYVERN